MKQVRKLWCVEAFDKRGKSPPMGDCLILARNLIEALQKAQSFLDEKYERGKFIVSSGAFEGTIDVF